MADVEKEVSPDETTATEDQQDKYNNPEATLREVL